MEHSRTKTLSSLLREFFGLAFLAAVLLGCSPSSAEQTTTVSIASGPLITSGFPFDQRNDDRPPFLLLSPNEASEYFSEFVWSAIVTNSSKGDEATIKEALAEIDELFKAAGAPGVVHSGNPHAIKYGYRLEVQYGTAPDTIEANLNALSNTLPQASWKRQGIGYIISSGNDATKAELLTAQSWPPCILLSPNLDTSLRFLTNLTGTRIQLTATQYVRAVFDCDPFDSPWRPYNPTQLHFRTSSDTSLVEFLKKLSSFHGCALHSTPDGFVIADASQQELRDRVRAMVSRFRGGGSYPDPWNFILPSSAAAELVAYLNDTDENTLQQVIICLMALNQRVGKPQLLHIARTFHGQQNTRAMAVCALAQMGSTEVLPFTYHLSDVNNYMFYALILAMSGHPSRRVF